MYFDKITAVNTSDLTPCNEIPWLSDQETMQNYAQATGDHDGVEEVNGTARQVLLNLLLVSAGMSH